MFVAQVTIAALGTHRWKVLRVSESNLIGVRLWNEALASNKRAAEMPSRDAARQGVLVAKPYEPVRQTEQVGTGFVTDDATSTSVEAYEGDDYG